jgi:hypothetical protein
MKPLKVILLWFLILSFIPVSISCRKGSNVKVSQQKINKYPASVLAETEDKINARMPRYKQLMARRAELYRIHQHYKNTPGKWVPPAQKEEFNKAHAEIKELNRLRIELLQLENIKGKCEDILAKQDALNKSTLNVPTDPDAGGGDGDGGGAGGCGDGH